MDTVFKGAVFRIVTEYKAGPNADHFTDIVISFLNESIFWLDCFHLSTSWAPEFHMLGKGKFSDQEIAHLPMHYI